MRKLVTAIALASLMGSMAFAADQNVPNYSFPTKAQKAQAPLLALTTSGPYFGLYTIGGMGSITPSSSITGVNPNSVTAVEASAGALVGYYWAMNTCSTCFLAVEGMFGWQNINGNTQGISFTGPASFKQRVLYGADAATIASVLPNLFPFPFPGFPSTIGNITNIKPYIYGSADEDDVSINVGAAANRTWSLAPEFGLGMLGQVTASTVVDVFTGLKFPQKGACVGVLAGQACAGLGTTAVAGLAVKW